MNVWKLLLQQQHNRKILYEEKNIQMIRNQKNDKASHIEEQMLPVQHKC